MVLRPVDYQLIEGQIYKMGLDNILRRCVLNHKGKIFCGNSIVELWEDMFEGKLWHIRYFKLDYGGIHYLKTQNSMIYLVTPAKE